MTTEQSNLDMGKRIEQGILLARKRMLHEKMLHGQDVVLGDGKGGIIRIAAKDVVATHKEYQ